MPLAHVFARIIEIGCLESGAILGHWADIGSVAEGLREFRPTFLLAVPRVFEKVYNTAQQRRRPARPRPGSSPRPPRPSPYSQARTRAGPAARPAGAARAVRPAGVRQAAGRRRRQGRLCGIRRCAPRRAARPLLPRRRDHRAGGLRHDGDLGGGHRQQAGPEQNRHGGPAPSRRAPLRIADDGEILLSGSIISPATGEPRRRPRKPSTPRAGCTPATSASLDDEGFLRVTGRKKELIVTAGGKNVAPAVLEDRLRAQPADQPVHGGRRQQAVHRLPDHA